MSDETSTPARVRWARLRARAEEGRRFPDAKALIVTRIDADPPPPELRLLAAAPELATLALLESA
jgi:hypothetical protein